MQIYDCFIFGVELDMLEIRLRHLWDHVDWFVLVEADHTHRGQPKEYVFENNKERFAWALSRIIHVKKALTVANRNFSSAESFSPHDDNFKMDSEQRNAIMDGLHSARDDDLILISDLDELPTHEAMRELEHLSLYYPVFNLRNHQYLYFLDYGVEIPNHIKYWAGTGVCRKKHLVTPQAIRDPRNWLPARINSGYHFSTLGGVQAVIRKFERTSHSEYDNSYFKNPQRIAKAMRDGLTIDYTYLIKLRRFDVNQDPCYPEWLKKNRERYSHLFYSEEAFRLELETNVPEAPPEHLTQSILERIVQLDAGDDTMGLIQLVQNQPHDPNVLLQAMQRLIGNGRLRSAYILAMLLANSGYHHLFIALARGVGGILFENPIEERSGLEDLRAHVHAMPEDQLNLLYQDYLVPTMRPGLETAIEGGDLERTHRFLEFMRAAMPSFRTRFDPEAKAPEWSPEGQRSRSRATAAVRLPPVHPAAVSRPPRRAVVALRTFHDPNKSWSRFPDLGHRIAAAMRARGWQAVECGMSYLDIQEEYRAVEAMCHQQDGNLVLFDDDLTQGAESVYQARIDLIQRLRRARPSIRVVLCLHAHGCRINVWPRGAVIKRLAAIFDGVWCVDSPHFAFWEDAAFTDRVLHLPFPVAGHHGSTDQPLASGLSFTGSVAGEKWPRAFWLAAAARQGLPLRRIPIPSGEGVEPLERHAAHMRALEEATCCINFSMQGDQERIVNHRAFEILHAGSLLVQEAVAGMDRYLVAGEHYLEFSTLAELSAIAGFITGDPAAAEVIRRAGHAFARANYSDERLIGMLDRFLDGTPPVHDYLKFSLL
ncbi:MAG: glycosyltransferase [Magnetococcales bacterium]|nr:glycosyltransferase [Magnetococcales bacterium]